MSGHSEGDISVPCAIVNTTTLDRGRRAVTERRGGILTNVTDFLVVPAVWNVFSVICVAGSPMDCAATTPHISPGAEKERNAAHASRDRHYCVHGNSRAWMAT